MYFYKLTRGSRTVFATASDVPILNPDYEETTREEYESFTGRPIQTEEELREVKLREIGEACSAAIYAGVDVGGAHYSLTEHDQTEIMAQYATVKEGAAAVPYHADGELCRMYPAEEFAALAQAATEHVFYQRTYCNHLNAWIRRAGLEELKGITYGAELPEDLEQSMMEILAEVEAEKTITVGGMDDAV